MHPMRAGGAVLLAVTLAACQPGGLREATPPRACGLAAFGAAPGLPLPPTEAAARRKGKATKSEPLKYANSIPVNGGVGDIGRWVDAAPGWQAWRLWLRSEEARSLAVHIKPLSLPPGAELWICSPDGTTRQGPYLGKGPSAGGQLWSPAVPGPELWLEVVAPADRIGEVKLIIDTAFAAFR